MYYTSIEQSKKLLELGLDPSTADMIYSVVNNDNIEYPDKPSLYTWKNSLVLYNYIKNIGRESIQQDIPCWSFGALFSLLPGEFKEYELNIDGEKGISYIHYATDHECSNDSIKVNFSSVDFMQNIFDMVVWLLEKEKYLFN